MNTWLEEKTLSELEKMLSKVTNDLYELEEKTNYEIDNISQAIALLQSTNIKREWQKSRVQNPVKEAK